MTPPAAVAAPQAPAPASAAELPAGAAGDALGTLLAQVARAPWAHDFFALLRRVDALRPGQPRTGRAQRPSQEALRLGQEPELDFAPAAVVALEPGAAGRAPRLGVRLFGLHGPNGPMPLHLTEYVRERLRHRGDATTARFLDVFHHRLLGLFYRAWADAQPAVQHDRPAEDRYAAWLGSCCGVAPAADAAASTGRAAATPGPHATAAGADAGRAAAVAGAVPDRAQRYQAGLLGARSRHPEALAKLLGHYFGWPVRVQCHVHHVLEIDAADRTRLGHARRRAAGQPLRGAGAQLGRGATVGSRATDRQSAFRVVLGPLSLAHYEALLPGHPGATWNALCAWVRLHAGLQFAWDVELHLAPAEVPPARLGRAVRLGLTAWLGARPRAAPVPGGAPAPASAFASARAAVPTCLRLRPATSFVALARPPHPGDPHG